jgi:hypothetical protein
MVSHCCLEGLCDDCIFDMLPSFVQKSKKLVLNEDVIIYILELLYFSPTGTIEYKDLASSSRISKLWTLPAQNLLFHACHINSRETLKALQRGLNTPRGEFLRRITRTLILDVAHHTPILGQEPKTLSELDIGPTLRLFPNLCELRLILRRIPSLSKAALRSLNAKSIPRIRALIVRIVDDGMDRYNDVIFQLLESFPSVERVSLDGRGTYRWQIRRTHSRPVPSRLRELRLNLHHSQPSPTGDDLSWLIADPELLDVLHLHDLVVDKTFEGFIQRVAPNLRALRLSSSLRGDLAHLPRWLDLMQRLEELVIRNDLPGADCFKASMDLGPLLDALPSTVTHLGFTLFSLTEFERAKCSLVTRRLANLTTLTLIITFRLSKCKLEAFRHVLRPQVLRLFKHTDEDIVFAYVGFSDASRLLFGCSRFVRIGKPTHFTTSLPPNVEF